MGGFYYKNITKDLLHIADYLFNVGDKY